MFQPGALIMFVGPESSSLLTLAIVILFTVKKILFEKTSKVTFAAFFSGPEVQV